MKTLEIKKNFEGQYLYRVLDHDNSTLIDWQYGSYDLQETRDQANSRFFFDREFAGSVFIH